MILISDKFSKGIIRAAKYADNLSQKKLSVVDLEYKRGDEVGILIKSLNNMKNNLRGSYEEIAAYNEEIRSINIDLETTNGKLEADNKEIVSLNEELEESYSELNKLNRDMEQMLYLTSKLDVERINEVEFLLLDS